MHPTKLFTAALAGACWLLSIALPAQTTALRLPDPDLERLTKQDAALESTRFAAPLALDVRPAQREYTYADGRWHWHQTVSLPGAHGLALYLDELAIPDGGEVYLETATDRRGPFTQADASSQNRLTTGFLPGQSVTLHYAGPLPDAPPFHLWRADHVYRPDRWAATLNKGFGISNACQINASCPQGDGWEDQRSGTGRIIVVTIQGSGYCTGNLLNNTARDGRPLLLTGFHCVDGFDPLYDLWTVDFDYAGADCADPPVEPVPTTYDGMRFLAGYRQSDMLLVEINDVGFAAEQHYFAGWDRNDGSFPAPIFHFHHPLGDVMKLGRSDAFGARPLTSPIQWNNNVITPANHHFRIRYDLGTFEIGSSGSAFFNQAGRVIGQLNGGNTDCSTGFTEAFVGRLRLSWDGGGLDSNRLSTWLDPLGTDPLTFDGETLTTKRFVRGRVTFNGLPAAGATLTFNSPAGPVTHVTDANGFYRGERAALLDAFTVQGSFQANGDPIRGVDVGDIIFIRRQILNFQDLTPTGQVAADVNGSGTIRVSDITTVTRAILAIDDWGTRPNWIVLPANFPLDPLPADPAAPIGIQIFEPGAHEVTIDFRAIKTGDAAGNVD